MVVFFNGVMFDVAKLGWVLGGKWCDNVASIGGKRKICIKFVDILLCVAVCTWPDIYRLWKKRVFFRLSFFFSC